MTEMETLILEQLRAMQADIRRLSESMEALQGTFHEGRLEQLRRDIAQGMAEADNGLFIDGSAAFASIRKYSAQRRSQ